jgi:hypothetical protein
MTPAMIHPRLGMAKLLGELPTPRDTPLAWVVHTTMFQLCNSHDELPHYTCTIQLFFLAPSGLV